MVGIETPRYFEQAADVTGDSQVNISDATKILDYIVGEIDELAPSRQLNYSVSPTASNGKQSRSRRAPVADTETADDAFYANASTLEAGQEALLEIGLKNAQPTNGYQFDLVLPEGFELAKDGTKYDCQLSSRHDGHAVRITYNESTRTYKVVVYSLASKVLTGSDGLACTLRVAASSNVARGKYMAAIQNGQYSLTSGEGFVALPRAEVALQVGSIVKGDANGDGLVNSNDAVAIVNYCLGHPADGFATEAADTNGDGKITMADVEGVVGIILNKQ